MLTTANVEHFRRNNFGRELLTRPLDAVSLGAEIDRYDAADAAAVSRILGGDATLDRQIDQLEAIFVEAIDRFEREAPSVEDARKALAAYLADHLPRPAAGDPAPRHVRFPPNPWIDEKLAAIEKRLSAAAEQTAALGQQLAATAEQAAADRRTFDAIAGKVVALDQQPSATAAQVGAIHERLSAVEAQVSSVRPLIRLLRPLALVLSRLWRLRRFAGPHSSRVPR